MREAEWQTLMAELHDMSSSSRAVEAATKLQASATHDDVPRLVALLADSNFFVREAAAWPLSDLGYVDALPQLIEAYNCGSQEGLDNDGLSAAITDLVSFNAATARPILEGIIASPKVEPREVAKWLIEFCE